MFGPATRPRSKTEMLVDGFQSFEGAPQKNWYEICKTERRAHQVGGGGFFLWLKLKSEAENKTASVTATGPCHSALLTFYSLVLFLVQKGLARFVSFLADHKSICSYFLLLEIIFKYLYNKYSKIQFIMTAINIYQMKFPHSFLSIVKSPGLLIGPNWDQKNCKWKKGWSLKITYIWHIQGFCFVKEKGYPLVDLRAPVMLFSSFFSVNPNEFPLVAFTVISKS